MSKYKLVIFDFDGTIAHSLSAYIEIYNKLATQHKLRKITKKDVQTIRRSSYKEIFKLLNISLLQVPMLLYEGRKHMLKLQTDIKLVRGILKVIDKINKRSKLIILTSNSRAYVKHFLQLNHIDYFAKIWSDINVFGKDKTLKKILKQYDLKPQEALYIADEVRDIEACKKAAVPIAAITWGFNAKSILKKHSPDFLFDAPSQLLTII